MEKQTIPNDTPRIGQTVQVGGKEGKVVERLGNEIRVKFYDGTFGFFDRTEIQDYSEILDHGGSMDSTLKRKIIKQHSEDWHSCVEQVSARGKVESPEAVCTESVGKEEEEMYPPENMDDEEHIRKLGEAFMRWMKEQTLQTKGTSCPFCKGAGFEIKMNNDLTKYTGEVVFQCFKCGSRFSDDKTNERRISNI